MPATGSLTGLIVIALLAVLAVVLIVAATALTVAIIERRRRAAARVRRLEAEAAQRSEAFLRVRTELEERQAEVLIRHVSTSGMPRARVLPPSLRALHDELHSIEALDTLVYDPAVWESTSTMADGGGGRESNPPDGDRPSQPL